MMPLPLQFFSVRYAPEFWTERDLVPDADVGVLGSVPRRGYPGLVGPDALAHRPDEQVTTRNLLQEHMRLQPPSLSCSALVVASQNVQTFNEAFPNVAPLTHPILCSDAPAATSIAQLNYELTSIECESREHAHVYEAGRELPAPLLGAGADSPLVFDLFMAEAEERATFELVRLEGKYADLGVPLGCVTPFMASLAAASGDKAVEVTPQLERQLRGLVRNLRQLRRQATSDLLVFESLYNKAAPIMRETASPRGQVGTPRRAACGHFGTPSPSPAGPGPLGLVDDASIELLLSKLSQLRVAVAKPASLPNLFGPGFLYHLSPGQVGAYGTLCGGLISGLNELRRVRVNPVVTELHLATQAATHFLNTRTQRMAKLRP